MTPEPRPSLRDRFGALAYVVVGSAAIAVGTVVGLAAAVGEFFASGMEPRETSQPADPLDEQPS
ncbi:hypothetical protein [Curtobacterium luteum]|uniref:Uncharacterized protein n=1 Tax=Curtobacterium luteum TaxID=33881 RepID=A0A175RZ76_9MICO|nr:hypothetical protein [Curtobacterium luteum]KTR08867.1 hypothetical protein NS184_04975 [Curtobacterium luteum]